MTGGQYVTDLAACIPIGDKERVGRCLLGLLGGRNLKFVRVATAVAKS
jgi:hypothetical protein